MTKSYRDDAADYTPNDMGVPDRLPTPEMWEKHNPNWETMNEEEKSAEIEKMDEIGMDTAVDYYDPLQPWCKDKNHLTNLKEAGGCKSCGRIFSLQHPYGRKV